MTKRVLTVTVAVQVHLDDDNRRGVPLVEDALQRALVLGLLEGNPKAGDSNSFLANDGAGPVPAHVEITAVSNTHEA